LIRRAILRLWRGLTTWPDARGWAEAALIGAATLAAMAAVGFGGGLYHLTSPQLSGLPMRMATVLIAPALGEEALFRGLFVPGRAETSRPWLAIALVTLVFTAWHAVEATTFLPKAAPIFLRPDFLLCAAILGLGAALVRWRSSSLWPGVGLHWLVVAVWQTWLGGPGLEALR
jgi:predicted Abi (CAAX) family protease